jgi:hypothetical protein
MTSDGASRPETASANSSQDQSTWISALRTFAGVLCGQNSTDGLCWRDGLVLFFSWLTAVYSTVSLLASLPLSTDELTRFGSHPLSALLIATIILPFAMLLLKLIPSSRLLSRWLRHKFQSTSSLCLLLLSLSVVQLLSVTDFKIEKAYIEYFSIISVLLLLVWFFYKRLKIELQSLILSSTWLLVLFQAKKILQIIFSRVDFVLASTPMKIFVIYHLFLTTLLIASPLFLSINSRRVLAKRLYARVYHGLPGIAFPALLILCFGLLAQLLLAKESIHLILLTISASQLFILSMGCWITFETNETSVFTPKAGLRDTSPRIFNLALVFILLGYLALMNSIHSNAINPDGLSYLTIARSFAEGHLVVRGYWSPLISLSLAPLIALGLDPYLAFRVITQVSGIGLVLAGILIGRRVGLKRVEQLAVGLAIALSLLVNQPYLVVPDLFAATILGFYFYFLMDKSMHLHPLRSGMTIGLVAALAYYARYYNFPFILIHLPLSALILRTGGWRKKSILATFGWATGVFLILTLPWILAIFNRYGSLTFTTSGKINHAIVGPRLSIHLCWGSQLCDQPPDVLFPWEDPLSEYYTNIGWKPFENLDNFRHQILLIWNNVIRWTGKTIFNLGSFPPFALLALGILALVSWTKPITRTIFGGAFLTICIYVSGYFITYSKDFRYYIPIIPILWVSVFGLLGKLTDHIQYKLVDRKRIFGVMFRLLILIMPLISYGWFWRLQSQLDSQGNYCLRDDSLAMANIIIPPFSGTDGVVNHIAYYTRLRTYGALSSTTPADTADLELRKTGVKSFLAASDSTLASILLSKYEYDVIKEITLCGKTHLLLKVPEG